MPQRLLSRGRVLRTAILTTEEPFTVGDLGIVFLLLYEIAVVVEL